MGRKERDRNTIGIRRHSDRRREITRDTGLIGNILHIVSTYAPHMIFSKGERGE